MVRCITVDPSGQWLASGGEDSTVKVWEVATARCLKTINVPGDHKVKGIAWNPNPAVCLIAVVV